MDLSKRFYEKFSIVQSIYTCETKSRVVAYTRGFQDPYRIKQMEASLAVDSATV